MAGSILNIGLTALNAAQAALVTTGHNISNAGTEGFHRQRVGLTTQTPQLSGGGFMGRGVAVADVARIYSQVLDRQTQVAQSQASYYTAYQLQVSRVNDLVADPTSGLTPALQDFFRAAQDLTASPSITTSRQAVLSQAGALLSRFGALDQRFGEVRTGVNAEIADTASEINSIATRIAQLNGRIAQLRTDSVSQPNDLLDQRDRLMMDLNRLVGAQAIRQDDGSFNVTIGTGQALVIGERVSALATAANSEDPRQLDIGYRTAGGLAPIDPDMLTGGTLGALLTFRSQTLDGVQNAFGRVALALGTAFNAQHRLGQDLNGVAGGDFFRVPSPVVTPGTGVTAAVAATVVDTGAITTSDYRVAWDGSQYRVTRLSDETVSGPFATLPQTVDGLSIALSAGTPAAGDTWLVQPTRYAARDLRLAITDTSRVAAAAPVAASAATGNTGTIAIAPPSVDAATQPPVNPALRNTVTLTFDAGGTTFDVVDVTAGTTLASNVAYTSGMSVNYNGWTTTLTGAARGGDQLQVQANTGGRNDSRNALLLAGLQTATVLDAGSSTLQTAYSSMVGDIGSTAREIEVTRLAQESILAETQRTQQSLSGVNLDEEAANLIRYQQAYQAASKVISTASRLFESILAIS